MQEYKRHFNTLERMPCTATAAAGVQESEEREHKPGSSWRGERAEGEPTCFFPQQAVYRDIVRLFSEVWSAGQEAVYASCSKGNSSFA